MKRSSFENSKAPITEVVAADFMSAEMHLSRKLKLTGTGKNKIFQSLLFKKKMVICIFKIVFTISLFFIGMNSTSAQPLNDLEKKYEKLNILLNKENKILDSLKIIFTKKTDQIDIEKKKKNPDNDVITGLMAGSVSVSNKIEEQNKKINHTEKEIESVKQQLHKLYSSKIDSLESLKKTGNEYSERLDNKILLLTEKNLLVAPRIPKLSFSPERILGIDLNKAKDEKEKSLYKEYLNNALNEVNILLGNVDLQISEVDQVVNLQTKTKKFLEEAELEGNMILQSKSNQTADISAHPRLTESSGATGVSNDFALNVKTYQLILSQLDIQQLSKSDLKWNTSSDEINRNFSAKEYQKLLKEVKKRLQEFKLVLANKTGSSK